MYNASQITITPVANGYVVVLPSLENDPMENLPKIMRDMAAEIQGDALLNSLQEKSEKDEQPNAEMVRDIHTYIFSKFSDVLAFLGEQFPKA